MNKKIAIPTLDGQSCGHFGHCQSFAIVEVEDSKIIRSEFVDPPVHQPGTYPRFLAEQGVTLVIAGGMGQMAQNLFQQNNIEIIMGVGVEAPDALVDKLLSGNLQTTGNACNHGADDHEPNCGH